MLSDDRNGAGTVPHSPSVTSTDVATAAADDSSIIGLIAGLQTALVQSLAATPKPTPTSHLAPQPALSAPPFSIVYAFGDSFSADNGQYSNGPVWVQDLAATLGLNGVTDFAVGGAMTGTTALHTANVTDLPTQLSTFAAQDASPPPDALYTVWIGANDVPAIESTPSMTAAAAVADITQAVTNEVNFISGLAQLGAKNLMVLNVPDQAPFPAFASQGPLPAYETSLLTQIYNQQLSTALRGLATSDGLRLDLVDTYTLFDQMVANPAAYGFTNVHDPVQYANVANPNQYLFWDNDHPTAGGHAQIAAAAALSLGLSA
jgi:phospholipase/lecithinase/hemolysin